MKTKTKRIVSRLAAFSVALGILGLPVVASAAADASSVDATVAPVISVTSSNNVNINVTPTGAGAEATASDAVSVDSNNATGYDLTLADSDATVTMAGFLASDGVTTNGDTLAATSGSYGTPASLSANSWGWRVDGLGAFGAGGTTTYAAVPATGSAQNIRSTSSTASAEVTTVKYAVKVNTSKKSGIYKDTITYTATAKP